MENKNLIIAIAVAIAVAVGAFFGGMQYQKSQASSFMQDGTFRQKINGQGTPQGLGQRQGGQNFNYIRGEVSSIDNDTVTIKLQDGSSKIVVLSGNTTYTKAASSQKEDLKTGDTVMIMGVSNSNGSVTAENVQINPLTIKRITPSAQ